MYDDEKFGYPKCDDDDCKALIEKFLTILLPVTTTPRVKVGKIKTECCGNPIVTPKKHEKCCDEMKNDSCKFTIIQKMKIEIPVDFDADTKVDDLMVDCEFKHEKYDYDKYEKSDKHDYDKKYDDKYEKCDYDKKDDDKKEKCDYDKKDDDKKEKCDYDRKDYDKHEKCDYDKKDDDKHEKCDCEKKDDYKKYC